MKKDHPIVSKKTSLRLIRPSKPIELSLKKEIVVRIGIFQSMDTVPAIFS
jgi:hypothetical protein